MTAHKVRCWRCGKENFLATSFDDESAIPANGDVSICIECGGVALFDDTVPDGVRKPTPSEKYELQNNEDVLRMVMAWYRMKQQQQGR